MKHRYLEVTFRRGKPFAAYLYLPRPPGVKSERTVDYGHGLLVDLDASGKPIGIEITAPAADSIEHIDALLVHLGLAPLPADEWAPLRAA